MLGIEGDGKVSTHRVHCQLNDAIVLGPRPPFGGSFQSYISFLPVSLLLPDNLSGRYPTFGVRFRLVEFGVLYISFL